jgi:hypothetical protein
MEQGPTTADALASVVAAELRQRVEAGEDLTEETQAEASQLDASQEGAVSQEGEDGSQAELSTSQPEGTQEGRQREVIEIDEDEVAEQAVSLLQVGTSQMTTHTALRFILI